MKTYNLKSNNLESLPLSELYNAYKNSEDKDKVLKDFSSFLTLSKKPWFLPQLLSHFPSKFPAKKVGNKYNLAATLGSMQDADRALYFLTLSPARSQIAGSRNLEYSSLVPLVLAGYKKYSNINYLDWDWESIKLGFSKPLHSCISINMQEYISSLNEYIDSEDLGIEKIEEYRDSAYLELMRLLRPRVNSGTGYNISVTNTPLAKTPQLLKYIELQAWAAHPSNRNKYMILDIRNLDNFPEPLVEVGESLVGSLSINDHPFLK